MRAVAYFSATWRSSYTSAASIVETAGMDHRMATVSAKAASGRDIMVRIRKMLRQITFGFET